MQEASDPATGAGASCIQTIIFRFVKSSVRAHCIRCVHSVCKRQPDCACAYHCRHWIGQKDKPLCACRSVAASRSGTDRASRQPQGIMPKPLPKTRRRSGVGNKEPAFGFGKKAQIADRSERFRPRHCVAARNGAISFNRMLFTENGRSRYPWIRGRNGAVNMIREGIP